MKCLYDIPRSVKQVLLFLLVTSGSHEVVIWQVKSIFETKLCVLCENIARKSRVKNIKYAKF